MGAVAVFEGDVGLGEGGEGWFGDGRGEGARLLGEETAGGCECGSKGHGFEIRCTE